MSRFSQQMLEQRRDGLLREAEHIEKRLKVIHHEVTALNTQIAPSVQLKPGQPGFTWPACEQCGSTSLRCGCD